jgi:hypothetical protein
MRGVLLASIAFALVGSSVAAQDRKGIRFWNLTLYTITTLQMSPAGKDSWDPDQCRNDRDGPGATTSSSPIRSAALASCGTSR